MELQETIQKKLSIVEDRLYYEPNKSEMSGIKAKLKDVMSMLSIKYRDNMSCYNNTLIAKREYLKKFHNGLTDKKCPKCGKQLKYSNIVGYSYQCESCDEDFFVCELNK